MSDPDSPIKRFANLPLSKRFHIVEELGCQLQPGPTPEKHAAATIGHVTQGEPLAKLLYLLAEAEQGPDILFPCGHKITVSQRNILDPFRCPACERS